MVHYLLRIQEAADSLNFFHILWPVVHIFYKADAELWAIKEYLHNDIASILRFFHWILFSLGLGQSKVLVLWFGPKMNTKVTVNTHHHHHPPQ